MFNLIQVLNSRLLDNAQVLVLFSIVFEALKHVSIIQFVTELAPFVLIFFFIAREFTWHVKFSNLTTCNNVV